jgi:hypothetical protein
MMLEKRPFAKYYLAMRYGKEEGHYMFHLTAQRYAEWSDIHFYLTKDTNNGY